VEVLSEAEAYYVDVEVEGHAPFAVSALGDLFLAFVQFGVASG